MVTSLTWTHIISPKGVRLSESKKKIKISHVYFDNIASNIFPTAPISLDTLWLHDKSSYYCNALLIIYIERAHHK